MATATLDAPLVLNPQQATTLRIEQTHIEHGARVVRFEFAMVAEDGVTILERRTLTATGAAVQNWITAQESTLYGRLLAALGVTGTVA